MAKTIKIKNLAIGSTIITLLYCLRTNTHCILQEAQKPFKLTSDLSCFDTSELKTIDPTEIWDRLCFVLGMSGLLLFPNNIQTIREEDGYVELISKRNRKTIIEYDDIVRFDTRKDDYVNVYDYFWCRAGGAHDVDRITDQQNEFVNTVLFPPRSVQVRDAVACSRMLSKDLLELDLTPNMARLKTISMMRNNGLKGLKNGFTASGQQDWIPPRLEWDKREVKYIYYSDMSLGEVFKLEQQRGYAWKLLENITHYIST